MNKTNAGVVVVGAGAAGHSAASTLRQEGYAGAVTVLHAEPYAPYNRTLVNKALLQGLLTAEQIALPALEPLGVELLRATAATIEPDASAVLLDNGRRLPYSALVAATGSRPRTGNLPLESDRLMHVHTVDDATRVRAMFGDSPGSRVVTLLGAGFIGAETASYLAEAGARVHLVSRSAVPLVPALGERLARHVAGLHEEQVTAHFGHQVGTVRVGRDSVTVTLDDGQRLEADAAVAAYGTLPASAWATGVDEGVPVDDRLRAATLPAGVYAAGSVAVHTARNGHRYRVDHWDAATAQGAHAARTLLHDLGSGPDPGPYVPSTGFTLILYRQAIASYGVALPGAIQRQHPTGNPGGILTTFHDPADQAQTAAVGLAAGRELLALRGHLQRP